MADVKADEDASAGRELLEGDDVIGQAVRGELADRLNVMPSMLSDLSPEAAARTLDHLNDINRRLHTFDEAHAESGNGRPQVDERRDVVARALRDELADKLRLHPRLLGGLRADAAAATLARVNDSARRLKAAEAGRRVDSISGEVVSERRDLVGRVIRDELSEELGVHPRELVDLNPQLAATTLSHLTHIHRRLRRLEGAQSREAAAQPAATIPDRRDIVARAIRDQLAERLGLEPRILGPLTPRAGAAMLSHLQHVYRRLNDLEQRIAVDELTGVLRRAAGQEAVEREIERARRGDGRLVLAFIDVDHLKTVNDVDGHAAGDSLLQTAAATLRSRLRRYDVVTRWGGDEFIAVLPQTDMDGARRIFDEIDAAYRSRTGGRTFSVGLAALQEHDGPEQLVDRADLELYAKKRERREAEQQTAAAQQPPPPAAGDSNGAKSGGSEAHTETREQPAAQEKPAQPLWKRWTAIGVFVVVVLVLAMTVMALRAVPGSVFFTPRALGDAVSVRLAGSPAQGEVGLAQSRLDAASSLAPGDRGPWLADAQSHLRAAEADGADPVRLRSVESRLETLKAGF